MEKKEYIRQLARFLITTETTMTGPTLATLLNWNGFQTDYGTRYAGARGTYTLIQATYNWLESIGEDDDAERVALAFKKPDGSYAYNK